MEKKSLYIYDQKIREKFDLILGIDEVGRGCVAGPLVVAGVILKKDFYNNHIQDSKKIKDINKRKSLAELIIANCLAYDYVIYSNYEVDKLNPKQCSINGMNKIANQLINQFDIAITDFEKIDQNINQINLKQGDATSFSVACASILAKHIRDQKIIELDKLYPQYDLINNSGYLTKKHQILINKFGINKNIYRLSYKPIKQLLNKNGEYHD